MQSKVAEIKNLLEFQEAFAVGIGLLNYESLLSISAHKPANI
jgi:hypothetical protein